MSATERIRAMLDERGVEWQAPTSFDNTARYDTVAGGYWFHEFNGKMTIHGLTPEQAIAATLGTGTCRNTAPSYLDFLCSECGFVHYHSDENDSGDGNEWHYCPNCGRRIEQ